jgi:hypothetical protein
MSDFKQQVEEIVSCYPGSMTRCKLFDKHGSCTKCQTTQILSAHNAELERIAKEMDKYKRSQMASMSPRKVEDFNLGVSMCQAYIQAQKGS